MRARVRSAGVQPSTQVRTEVLESLYRRHGAHAFGLACGMLGDREVAADVVRAVFVSFPHDKSILDEEPAAVRSRLLRSVQIHCRDHVRGVEQSEQKAPHREDVLEATLGSGMSLALLALPPEQRRAIELAYFGCTRGEIAERLGIPVGAVASLLRSALYAMRSLAGLAAEAAG